MLEAIWGIFFKILSWMIYPSTQNPILPFLGVVAFSFILTGFLKTLGFMEKYPNG